jgi:hypothetical protein
MPTEHKTRIMYIERKAGELSGNARIGRVTYSKTMRSLYYAGKTYSMAEGFKSNFVEEETGEDYWISGPRRDGQDSLYATNIPVEIDDDVREEYWTEIRRKPEWKDRSTTSGKKKGK